MSRIPAAMAFIVLSSLVPGSAGAEGEKVTAVLELFTSQGCASCPPADEALESFAKRADIVALSLSVDYWDYQGWKDTLAEHAFTSRQKAYASARGDRQVYTPQMIVNGRVHVVGSNEEAIERAIAEGPAPSVPISVGMMGDAIRVSVGAAGKGEPKKATLVLALYERHVKVPIERGENRGRTLSYYNVVRRLRPIAVWRGEPLKVDLPMAEYRETGTDGCAVFLQEEAADGGPGAIIGAAHVEKAGESW
ncbi:DUF1223 domain-containing protein [Kaistia geumhonensis]|uniref:DUF1223 domain-containing protein n=1 Tax=Kaistia geumhonensis TaxID=410839 RepID=A0ABU0M871_9HYPH|nr:DUF1223 domain-containing protein [Kaistia geumhonensis]MCX5477627.1 DUF1223 domain-containing protein [Kaistia geumhonensis]MDQ0517165.1 hypothetical protein [Kaistia geumhonensis]